MNKVISMTTALLLLLSITACTPEVGSEKWCNNMKETPKGEWSLNNASDFTQHCFSK